MPLFVSFRATKPALVSMEPCRNLCFCFHNIRLPISSDSLCSDVVLRSFVLDLLRNGFSRRRVTIASPATIRTWPRKLSACRAPLAIICRKLVRLFVGCWFCNSHFTQLSAKVNKLALAARLVQVASFLFINCVRIQARTTTSPPRRAVHCAPWQPSAQTETSAGPPDANNARYLSVSVSVRVVYSHFMRSLALITCSLALVCV